MDPGYDAAAPPPESGGGGGGGGTPWLDAMMSMLILAWVCWIMIMIMIGCYLCFAIAFIIFGNQ